MIKLFYTTFFSVDLAQYEIFRAKFSIYGNLYISLSSKGGSTLEGKNMLLGEKKSFNEVEL